MTSRRPLVIMFCNFPPPYTGQAIGTALVKKTFEESKEIEVMGLNTSIGTFGVSDTKIKGFLRAFYYTRAAIWCLFAKITNLSRILYVVPSARPLGLIRDLLLALAFKFSGGRAVVWHIRNGNFSKHFELPLFGSCIKWGIRHISLLIFLSEGLAEPVRKHIPPSKIRVIFNPIDEEVEGTTEEVERAIAVKANSEIFKILFLSNMIPSKGYEDLAKALQLVKEIKQNRRIQVDYVGAWPSIVARKKFEDKLLKLGIGDIVTVHGGISDRKLIKSFYLMAHVFVLPTYYLKEAQPRSIIEAMSCGVPIIGTKHAAIPEYVFEGRNGFLVSPQSCQEIAEGLEVLMNANCWKKYAFEARQIYEEKFSRKLLGEELCKTLVNVF